MMSNKSRHQTLVFNVHTASPLNWVFMSTKAKFMDRQRPLTQPWIRLLCFYWWLLCSEKFQNCESRGHHTWLWIFTVKRIDRGCTTATCKPMMSPARLSIRPKIFDNIVLCVQTKNCFQAGNERRTKNRWPNIGSRRQISFKYVLEANFLATRNALSCIQIDWLEEPGLDRIR